MRKKLSLQIEKLRVEQFVVQSGACVTRGTVHGFGTHSYTFGDEACVCFPMPGSQYLFFTECC